MKKSAVETSETRVGKTIWTIHWRFSSCLEKEYNKDTRAVPVEIQRETTKSLWLRLEGGITRRVSKNSIIVYGSLIEAYDSEIIQNEKSLAWQKESISDTEETIKRLRLARKKLRETEKKED